MPRWLSAATLLAALVAPAQAQSELSGGPAGLAASGSYAGVVAQTGYASLSDLRASGVSLDATYGRVSVGAGLAFYRYETPVTLAVGVHLERDPAALRTTTVGATLQLLEDTSYLTGSISHARRAFGGPGLAVVPSGTVGVAVPAEGGWEAPVVAVASGSVGVVLGRGRTRGVVMPSVAWARGGDETVTLGVSAGVVRDLGRR